MIEKLLDDYDLKARVAPGLIVAFPVLVDAVYAAPILSSWPIFAAGGVCGLALVYGLGHVARARGEAIEAKLWEGWGGPPSTRFLRHRDSFFGKDLKASICNLLVKRFQSRLLMPAEEVEDTERADKAIVEAFRQVRQYLRQHDAHGLWYHHDVEYGFSRNLLGCRMLWTTVALAATVFAAIHGTKTGTGLLNLASAISFLSFICAVCMGWVILPGAAKRIADGYAETSWMAFLHVNEKPQTNR